MKKLLFRALSLLLVALMTLSLCSCERIRQAVHRTLMKTLSIKDPDIKDGDNNPYLNIEPDPSTYNEGYEAVPSRYSYQALPLEGEQKLYGILIDSFYEVSPRYSEEAQKYPMPEIRLDGYSLTEAQVRTTLKAISDDCPEIFWISNTIGYYANDEMTIV